MTIGLSQKMKALGLAASRVVARLLPPSADREAIADLIGYIENAGAPTSVTPDFIGQLLYDTTNAQFCRAYGTSSGNWLQNVGFSADVTGLVGPDGDSYPVPVLGLSTTNSSAAATANVAAIQARLNAGGTVQIATPGTYYINSQLIVPNNVRFVGAGKRSLTLKAHSTFPVSTAMILLGAVADEFAFDSRVERMLLDASGISGSICVKSSKLQEGGGCSSVNFNNYVDKGVSLVTACQNTNWDDLECYSAVATAGAIGFHTTGSGAMSGSHYLNRITCSTNDSGSATTGIDIGSGNWLISAVHIERHTTGVKIGAGVTGVLMSVDGPTVAAEDTVVDLVSLGSNTFVVQGVLKNRATTAVNDTVSAGVSWKQPFIANYTALIASTSHGADVEATNIHIGGAAVMWGTSSPELVVYARVGAIFLRADGGANTTIYVKESGSGNTGWVAK